MSAISAPRSTNAIVAGFALVTLCVASIGGGADPLVDLTFLPADNVAGDGYGPAAVQADGKVLLGMRIGGADRTQRLNPDGSIDGGFLPVPGHGPTLVAPNGDVVVAAEAIAWPEVGMLNRADRNGNLKWSRPHGMEMVRGAFFHSDSRVVVFGRGGMRRFSSTGQEDNAFVAPFTGSTWSLPEVWAAVPLPNGKIMASHYVSGVGASGTRLVRLNADGSLDAQFPAIDLAYGAAQSLAALPDGKLLVGGGTSTGPGVIRLLPDGTEDATFRAPPYSAGTMVVQPDGKILIGGGFLGEPVNLRAYPALLTRLNPDGSWDASFGCPLCGYENEDGQSVHHLAIDSLGNVIATGSFFVPGTPLYGVVRLKTAPPVPVVQFAVARQSVRENAGQAIIRVTRTGNAAAVSSVAYLSLGGTAAPWRDFIPRFGTLVFGTGETEKFLRLPIIADRRRERAEVVWLWLASPLPATRLGEPAATALWILDP